MGIGRIDQECRGTIRPVHWSAEGYMDMCAGVRRTTYLFADAGNAYRPVHRSEIDVESCAQLGDWCRELCTVRRLMSRAVHSSEIDIEGCAQGGD